MWGSLRLLPIVCLMAGSGAARPASAQEAVTPCQLCAPAIGAPGDAPVLPARLELETNLDFDRLVVTGPAGGTARLDPDGSAVTSGAVQLSGRAMVGTGVIHGEAGRLVRIDLPGRIALEGSNGREITIDRLTTDVPSVARLDSNGQLTFRFGGALNVSGDAEGAYRGDVAITVDYL